MDLDRRSLLKALGLSTAAASLGACGTDIAYGADPRPPEPDAPWPGVGAADEERFPEGVQCGDPLPDGVIVWTHYTGTAAVELIVARAVDGAWVEDAPIPVEVDPDGGFVHHPLSGLAPGQPFAYQLRDAEGACSSIGRARTAPAPDARPVVRLAATSCASQGHGDFPSMPAAMVRGPVDLFCWLGDTVYNDGVTTVAGYRRNWQRQLATQGFQSVLAYAPCAYTWDDHEVDNDWTDTVYQPAVDPERLEIAYDAFFDHTPTRRDPDDPRRLYRSFRFGRTCEVFVLDCRGERDEEAGVYISEAQMQWLLDGLSNSPCTWKVLLNSVPITNLPEIYDIDQVVRDRWDGYPAQREQLLGHIVDNRIRGVLFVSGDVHHATFCRIDVPGDPAERLLEIFTGPAGSSRNPLGALLEDEEQFLWSDAVWNTTRIDLHPDGTCRIEVVGEEGQTWLATLFDDAGNVLLLDGDHDEER